MKSEKKYRWKKTKIMLKGIIRKARIPNISWFVFGICIFLLAMLLMPKVFHRSPLLDFFIAEISGEILTDELEDIYISIGGFSERIDETGEYRLSFISGKKDNIPICITNKEGELLIYQLISFQNNQWSIRVDFDMSRGEENVI